jgi:hypothetical protein
MTRTRTIIAALALTALAAVVAAPVQAGAAGDGPTATASAVYLTIGEAQREARYRIGRDAREDGTLDYREVEPCWRMSSRRVRCDYYYEATDFDGFEYACEGVMQVIEFASFYRTQGIGTDCY